MKNIRSNSGSNGGELISSNLANRLDIDAEARDEISSQFRVNRIALHRRLETSIFVKRIVVLREKDTRLEHDFRTFEPAMTNASGRGARGTIGFPKQHAD